MGDLSPHFNRSEFACRCGCGLSRPSPELIAALEKLRAAVGRPIIVRSGSRCWNHNKTVGGAAHSKHLVPRTSSAPNGVWSLAADIVIHGLRLKQMYAAAVSVPELAAGGIGVYYRSSPPMESWFMHVDVRTKSARWGELDGEAEPLVLVLHASGQEEEST